MRPPAHRGLRRRPGGKSEIKVTSIERIACVLLFIFILDSRRFLLYWVVVFTDFSQTRGVRQYADNFSQIQQIDMCVVLPGRGIDAI